VRDIISRIEADGWVQVSQEGSHRQFKHPSKRGRLTVAGHKGGGVPTGTIKNIIKQAQLASDMQYAVIFEKETNSDWGAYVPDLQGCVAVAKTRDEVDRLIREALVIHIRGMREDAELVPEPTSFAGTVVVEAA
jgi:predicted RNA binding protein YcfA (HicA-like mRNA interferase family)/predicted RNase H-like HicB family nuclease